MATLTFPGLWLLKDAISGRVRMAAPPADPQDAVDARRAEREFVNEVIWENPGAFSGDLDIQHMMQMFPGRF